MAWPSQCSSEMHRSNQSTPPWQSTGCTFAYVDQRKWREGGLHTPVRAGWLLAGALQAGLQLMARGSAREKQIIVPDFVALTVGRVPDILCADVLPVFPCEETVYVSPWRRWERLRICPLYSSAGETRLPTDEGRIAFTLCHF